MRSFIFYTLGQYYENDYNEWNEMGSEGNMRNLYKILIKDLKRWHFLGYLREYDRIILESNIQKEVLRF